MAQSSKGVAGESLRTKLCKTRPWLTQGLQVQTLKPDAESVCKCCIYRIYGHMGSSESANAPGWPGRIGVMFPVTESTL